MKFSSVYHILPALSNPDVYRLARADSSGYCSRPSDFGTILCIEGVNSNNFCTQNAKGQAFWRMLLTTYVDV